MKAGSKERCGCGNERIILPGDPRTVYEPSEAGSITIAVGQEVYLKPVGGDKASTYLKLWVEKKMLAFMSEPFAPLVLSMDLFSTKGYDLSKIAEVLPKQSEPPVFITGEEKTPIFAINAVDVAAETITITLDKDVEAFDPDALQESGHNCQ